jgi:hypothetical protein
MDCLPSRIGSWDELTGAVERCALEYGGPNWVSLMMTGLATVLMVGLAVFTLFLLVRALR